MLSRTPRIINLSSPYKKVLITVTGQVKFSIEHIAGHGSVKVTDNLKEI